MKYSHPKIPEGWTYLVHGTNLLRKEWNEGHVTLFSDDVFIINSFGGLSVITREEQLSDERFNTTGTYSGYKRPPSMSDAEFNLRNKTLQIRVIFFQNYFLYPKLKSKFLPKIEEKNREYIMELVKKYYWDNYFHGRHPCIPNKTRLVKIAHVVEAKEEILYYIPEELLQIYANW